MARRLHVVSDLIRDTTSDSETLAYLLLLAKCLKEEDVEMTDELQGSLCEAIGISFLHRLLKSKGSVETTKLYKEISLSIIVGLFLRTEERRELEKMIPDLVSVARDPTYTNLQNLHPNIIKTLYYLCSIPGAETKLHMFTLLCNQPSFMFQSPHRKNWCQLVARCITTIPTFMVTGSRQDVAKRSKFDQIVLELIETSFEAFLDRAKTSSSDQYCQRLNCLAIIFNADQSLFKRKDFSEKFLDIFSEMIKYADKLSLTSRAEILGVGPLISSQFNLDNSPDELVILYRLSAIELKLQLENVVQGVEKEKEMEEGEEAKEAHPPNLGDKDSKNPIYQVPDVDENEDHENKNVENPESNKVETDENPKVNEQPLIEDDIENPGARVKTMDVVEDPMLPTYCIVNCCQSIENCIKQLVNGDTVTEHTQSLIDAIRMALSSVMFFLRNSDCLEHDSANAVIRLFACWLTEDTGELEDIKATLKVLVPLLCDDKRAMLGLFVSAINNQMEHEGFQSFVETDLCPELISFAKANIWEEEFINLVPIFNELLNQDKYPLIPGNEGTSGLPFTVQLPDKIDLRYLSTVQLQCFLYMCYHKQRSNLLVTKIDAFEWMNRILVFTLSPFNSPLSANWEEGLPSDWADLKDVWLSTVHAVCLVINTVPDPSRISCDLTSLAAKCANYSETYNEVTCSLETLLASLGARES